MQYLLNLSGGTASAVAADRAINRYGRRSVSLWFADTSFEDEDLYRFLDALGERWDTPIHRITDGRTPLQVFEDEHIIPNSLIAPCSHRLKGRLLDQVAGLMVKPITRLIGMSWQEQKRVARMRKFYEGKDGMFVDFPLLWKPLEFRLPYDVVTSWGITPPRLYDIGMPHNNCGGRCVRQGQSEWLRLRRYFPERFAEMRDWEAKMRASDPMYAAHTFLKDRRGGETNPLTLAELEERFPPVTCDLFTGIEKDDTSTCFCNDWEVA